MKIDKELMKTLLKLDDRALWNKIREMADKYGYNLPCDTPSAENMKKLRTVLENVDKISTADLVRLMSMFKAKKNK